MAGERAGRAGFVGELAEQEMLAGVRAGRAGIITWGESWQSWNHYLGRELAELEMLAGERAGGAGNIGW